MIGRDEELARIAQATAEPDCRGVVISAKAGVGKSRLAREACAAAVGDGAVVDWVQATSSAATVPLGALAGLLPDDVRTDDTLELMRRSVEVLLDRAGGRPVVLGVDDAQLLDPVSAALVLHLATTGSAFVIATLRVGEPLPDAIVSLWKDGGAQRLELERLSDEDVGVLVEAALEGPVAQSALSWVRENSQGNALYVRELVTGAVDRGTLAYSRGLWRLSGQPEVSQSLAELVSMRMAGLGDDVRAPLELLAIGEPLRLAELTTLTDGESLVAAESYGMAEVSIRTGGDEMRLAHPLYGEVIRRELPVLRARQMRLRLAATVQERDPLLPDDALRVAQWLLDAQASVPLTLLIDGARAARLSGDPDLAVNLAGIAVEAGGGEQATLLLAQAHTARKQYEQAEAILAPLEGKIATQARCDRVPRAPCGSGPLLGAPASRGRAGAAAAGTEVVARAGVAAAAGSDPLVPRLARRPLRGNRRRLRGDPRRSRSRPRRAPSDGAGPRGVAVLHGARAGRLRARETYPPVGPAAGRVRDAGAGGVHDRGSRDRRRLGGLRRLYDRDLERCGAGQRPRGRRHQRQRAREHAVPAGPLQGHGTLAGRVGDAPGAQRRARARS